MRLNNRASATLRGKTMPPTFASNFRQFQTRARAALAGLRRESSARETELRELRDEEMRLARLARRVASSTPSPRHSAGSGRVTWRHVLATLPTKFGPSHLE